MLLDKIASYPLESQQYLERYANDGSPSGFTQKNTTSPHTDPFGLSPWFHLSICKAENHFFRTFGKIPNSKVVSDDSENWILVHPDMVVNPIFNHQSLSLRHFSRFKVVPTASARTVQVNSKFQHDYIKLHYDGVLGRVNRALPYKKAVAGPEINSYIKDAIDNNLLHPSLTILQELGARVLFVEIEEQFFEFGMVWRDANPYGSVSDSITYICPFFSLFSVDRLASYEPLLLEQMINNNSLSPTEIIISKLVEPIIGSYFSLISKLGFQAEWNAQNMLIGLDDQFNIISIIMRDMGDIEKDITIRDDLGLSNDFVSFPYKCISANDETYRIRHSFAFDFKLSEYIILPLTSLLVEKYNINPKIVYNKVKEIVCHYMEDLPDDFFPLNGRWYNHDRILLTGKRPYVDNGNPKFR